MSNSMAASLTGFSAGLSAVVRYTWSLYREAQLLWDMEVCAMLKTLLYFVLNTYIGFTFMLLLNT
ncbi:hypothetical protein HanXRQr2_Chr08g0349021 [Helianthus annuus]|uniref:Uncharacterized protein n=1 Tax=Helianthus annuus TaxID=4232 RepID=A0A9K3IGS5_HELAN|nr:hypothetical protein HanXRQr2_Chr08g0349021 [Helianthus annuus]